MVNRFERFIFTISEIDKNWHKIASDAMTEYGLKGPYAIYLVTMYKHTDGITATRLCELCNRNKADVSRAMSDMIKKGLVTRNADNSYRAPLFLTDEGRAAAETVSALAEKAVEMGGKGLSDKEREIFYQTLELIANNLRIVSEAGLKHNESI